MKWKPITDRATSPLPSALGKAAAAVVLAFLMLGPTVALRASTIVPGVTMTGFGNYDMGDSSEYSLGYTFTTTQTLTITALGTMDAGGDTIATASGPIPVKLYYSAIPPDTTSTVDGGQTSGTLVPGAAVLVSGTSTILSITGTAYTSGDGYRYTDLSSPIPLPAGTYELVSSTLGMRPQFAYNPTGLAEVAGMGPPNNIYNNDGNTTADYATNNFPGNSGGDYGPNFLVQVPEPSTAVIFGLGPVILLARRRYARA